MPYESQIKAIWSKLSTEGSRRRPTSSLHTFENVCQAFYQAENCPESEPATKDIRIFRAEYNIWAYYFGEDVEFLGVDPAQDDRDTPSPLTPDFGKPFNKNVPSLQARKVREQLEKIWETRRNREGYQPQLGWNPATGEPWMAVRSYATNSYPALCGPHHVYLKELEKMIPDFILQYERFPEQRSTLIWPEFTDPAKLKNQGAWEKFGELRAFLAEWVVHSGTAPIITQAFKDFRSRALHQRRGLSLPAGFMLDRGHIASLLAKARIADTSASSSRSSRSGRNLTGSGRRPDKHDTDRYRPRSSTSLRRKSASSGCFGPQRDDQNRVIKSEHSNRSTDRCKSITSTQNSSILERRSRGIDRDMGRKKSRKSAGSQGEGECLRS